VTPEPPVTADYTPERLSEEDRELVVSYLRELRDAVDLPMHHKADIDQFLVEALGASDE
jgi:hypothetical protein